MQQYGSARCSVVSLYFHISESFFPLLPFPTIVLGDPFSVDLVLLEIDE